MVEASTELLGGAAVTVFLALLFFGVVVLWDVALALRSVGDKIDKLEDNIDDDLTDIAHSLDGMSNGPGGGGGTQLHLSGGTISSGPGATQPQQAGQQRAAGPQQAAAGGADAPGGVGPQPRSNPQHHPEAGQTARHDPESSEESSSSEPSEESDSPDSERPDEGVTEPGEEVPRADDERDSREPADGESPDDASDSDGDGDADEPSTHPRAEINRGRFVTSPDRTAWYATPLDRDAIAAGPAIAGALPDGSESGVDESEAIAAGPVGSSESTADGEADATATAMPASNAEPAADEETDDGREAPDDADDDGTDGDGADADGIDGDDAELELEETSNAVGDDDIPRSPDEIDVLSFDDGDADDSADRTAVAPADEDGAADEGPRPDGPDAAAELDDLERSADESAVEPDAAVSSEGEAAGSEIDDDDADEGETGGDAADDPPADALSEFEFDEDEFEADGEDVTVEEAVDAMNEDAPAPELSSHRFDVTAEGTDDGSAVLTFEFGPETVDISGSTKRLLQYQMQSFANRESTPDGDVTIGRKRIVVEIPDSDGTAVQQWGDAAVSIIDRTLYLSDNSTDE